MLLIARIARCATKEGLKLTEQTEKPMPSGARAIVISAIYFQLISAGAEYK